MYCPNCGESLPQQALFCAECGHSIHSSKPNITEYNSNLPNNNQYSSNQYNNNQQIESPYEMIRLGEPKAPNRNLFVIIGIVGIAIILLSTIIIFVLKGKTEESDTTYTKETYIEVPIGELTAQQIEGQWQVSLYDDGEYRHKEVWTWIITPSDKTNFVISLPPDELFDEELDVEGIEGIEDITITARLEKNILYVKLPTEDTIPVALAIKNGKLQGEGKLIIGDPEGDLTITLEMIKAY